MTINNIQEFTRYCRSNNLNTNQIIKLIETAFKTLIFDTNKIDSESLLNQFEVFYNKYYLNGNEHPLFFVTNENGIINELDLNLVN